MSRISAQSMEIAYKTSFHQEGVFVNFREENISESSQDELQAIIPEH